MRATTRLAAQLLGAVLLLAVGCKSFEEVAPGTIVTCSTAADCPSGRVCSRSRCILPSELGTPPDLVLVDGKLAVAPAAGRGGTTFTVAVEATKQLEAPPRVILSLDSLVELPCTATGVRTYSCTYTADGTERGGLGGHVTVDVRLVDLAGQEAVKNGVGGFDLDFAPPVLAARSVAPASVALGGTLQVFFTTGEDLGPSPVLVASRALDEPGGDGLHFALTRQPGTRNYLFTHTVTAADGAGAVEFTVDATDAVGNAAAALPVGSVVLDPVPPAISALAVSSPRLAAGGTLTVTFDASEAAATETLAVTVGGRPLDCGAYSAGTPSYTCTRDMMGDEIAAGTEAVQSVVVALADAAGNRSTGSASVVFDFKPPSLASRSAGPASVALGGTLAVSFTPDEDLRAAPVLVASRALDHAGGTRFALTAQPGTRSYQFTHVVTAADAAGPVDFTVELEDAVGNRVAGAAVGSVTIDNVVPVISGVAAGPSPLGRTGTLTVTFNTTEAAAADTLAVTVGGRAMTCGAYSGAPPSYTCTRAMAGNEIPDGTEAAQSIGVSLADAAGNRASASGAAVVFDLKAPALSGGSAGPAQAPLGGTLVVSFTPDEELGPSPVLVASRALDHAGGTRFPLTPQPGTRNYQFTHVVTAGDPAGTVTFTAEASDRVGNAATGLAVGSVTIDNGVPVISSVAALPDRLGRTGNLTVTFSSTEAAGTDALAVTVGGRAMSCGAYSGAPPSYTCTRPMAGDEIALGTEAAQSIAISLADAAGNRASASGSAVIFDFAAPTLASSSAEPQSVPLGGVVLVSFTPSEELGASAVLVASRPLDGIGGDGRHVLLAPQPGTRSYLFTHLVTTADTSGPVTFTAELTDVVGNSVASVPVGGVTLDTVAPLVSGLAVAPPRLGRSGTLTATFDVDGAVTGLTVTVGGRPMTCGGFSQTSPSYTCTRTMAGTEIPLGTEAVQPVVVSLADAAGNPARASASTLFDFKPPALAARSAAPASVPLGGTLVVSLTPDEDLGAAPVLVASRALDHAGGTRFALTAQPGTRSYQFTHVVTAADASGPVDFSVDLADAVENGATGVAVGSVTIDSVVPAISGVAAAPDRLGTTGVLTVTFDSTEPAATGTLAVTVGGRPMTCGAFSGTSPSYTCTRAMAADDIPAGTEAAQSLSVSLADAAGNRASGTGSAVVFDFKAPALSGASAGPAQAPLGGTLVVSFTPDEELGANPVLVASRALDHAGGTRFPLTPQPGTRNYQFTHVVTAGDPAGTVTFTAEATDRVGNTATGLAVGSVTIDNVVPVISGVAAVPDRLGTSGTLTVTFNSTEPAATDTLAVTVGGRPMDCGAYSAGAYTCTRAMQGTEIPTGTEAAQSIAVSLADVAGNRASASGSAVIFDFAAPALAGSSAEPQNVPLGGVLLVSFTPSEELGANPVLVASRALDEPGATRFPLTPQPGTRSYLFTHLVTTSDTSGPVTFTAELTDLVGNAVLDVPVGSVTIDTLAPLVSEVAVSPARAGRSDTVTATFGVDGPAASGTLHVTVGGRTMSCGAYSDGGTYTCTYPMAGDEIALGTEAVQPVVVSLADVAGNPARASASTLFDFKAPSLAARSAGPADVPLGGTLLVTFTPDEELGPDPVLVATWTAPARFAGGVNLVPVRQAGTRNYSFTYPVTAADATGTVTFAANVADPVGNSTTALAVGSVRIDVDAIAVTTPGVSPARIRNTGTLTVTFDASEAASTLTATVGGLTMACGAYQPGSPRYTCTRAMVGNEIPAGTEAAQSVVVTLTDAAGNRTSASGSTVFDFRAPAVASAAVAYAAPDASAIPTVARAAVGARVTMTVLADEALGAPTPSLVARSGPYTLSFTYQAAASTATSAVFSATVPGGLADGDYAPSLTWSDVAGNAVTTGAGLPAVRLKVTAPSLTVDQNALVFVRSPIGNAAPEVRGAYTIPAGPYFAIDPSDVFTTATTLPASSLLLAGGAVPSRVIVRSSSDRATAMVVGTLEPGASGLFPRKNLPSPDVVSVWLFGVDDAGNESAGVQVRDVEWVATPNGDALGTNPHALLGASWTGEARDLADADVEVVNAFAAGADADSARVGAPTVPVWRDMTWSGASPAGSGAGLAYDSARGRTVLFGGRDVLAGLQGQTWEWDGTRWTLLPVAGPPAREDPRMVYDSARGRVVLFGGGTWEWDGSEWTQLAADGVPTAGGELVYHVARARTMLVATSGTWDWDGMSWTPVATPATPIAGLTAYDCARDRIVVAGAASTAVWNGSSWTTYAGGAGTSGSTIAYDTTRSRVVVTGGTTTYTYTWDGASWTTLTVTSPGNGTYGLAMAHDSARGATVAYADGATWEWDGSRWSKAGVPPGRMDHAMVYDSARSRVVMFGGMLDGSVLANDTWEWSGWGWREIATTGPTARHQHAMAYDAARSRTVVFGGFDVGRLADTWTFNGATATWTNTGVAGPAARRGAKMVYDPSHTPQSIILMGGDATVASGSPYQRDTWRWNGTTWTQLTTGTLPVRRAYHALAHDPLRQRVVMFGGNNESSTNLSDTLEWDGVNWTTVATGGAQRTESAMTYDTGGRRTVLFGGDDTEGTRYGPRNDTWEWNGTSWTLVSASGPQPRNRHAMAYDGARWRQVMFGGRVTGMTSLSSETWTRTMGGLPTVQFQVSGGPLAQVDRSLVQSVRVRAYAGATSPAGTAGAALYGWSSNDGVRRPGAWVLLRTNGNGVATSPPWLPPAPGSLMDWQSSTATIAQQHLVNGLAFRLRPSGGVGSAGNAAAVALDYIEVRVRYTAPP